MSGPIFIVSVISRLIQRLVTFQHNLNDNAFFQQVRAYVNLGIVPDQYDQRNFSFVNETSRFLVTLFDRTVLQAPIFQTIHLVNPHITHLSGILTDPKTGLKIRQVPFPEFIDTIARRYGAKGFSEYIDRLLLHLGWRSLLEGKTETSFIVHSEMSIRLLCLCQCTWSVPNARIMSRFVDQTLSDRVRFLSSMPSFEKTLPDHLITLAKVLTPVSVKASEVVQRENQEVDGVSLIAEGFAEVYKHSVDGWEGTIRLLGPGDIIGEESIIPAKGYCTVEAFEEVFLYRVSTPADISTCMENNPEIAIGFIKILSETIKKLESILIEVGI